MSKETGVALIGYGFVGQNFHAPLIASTTGLRLALVSSSRPDKVHEHFPDALVTADAIAAIHAEQVQLVVIASPNSSHEPLTRAALNAGKHVVCDKPFTITTAQASSLARLAEDKGLLLSVFHNRRWDADYLTLRKLIADDRLGTIACFESHIDRFRPQVRDRWREQPGPGAGLWYDLGPHLIDQSLQLFGLPETVEAAIFAQRPGGKTDDYAHVLLGYAGGLQAILHASMLAAGGSVRLLVHGRRGSWRKTGMDVQEPQLISGLRPGDEQWGVDPEDGVLFTGATDGRNQPPAESRVTNERGCYECFYSGVRDAILGHGENPVPAAQAVQVMAVLEAAQESARTGERVRFRLSD